MADPPRVTDEASANLAAARIDLAAARAAGDEARAAVLEALVGCGGSLLIYRPSEDHFGVQLGTVEEADHIAVMVPGVGTDDNLRDQWLPSAANLYAAAESTTVILWKAYDEPSGIAAAAARTMACDNHVRESAALLSLFVRSLPRRPDQSLTIVAHSFGSIVTGAALAHYGLECTNVVVAGSPGMDVDDLRQLHLDAAHFFAEQAPGDAVAELGVFGAEPTSPLFGGTRMATNAAGHVEVGAHSAYFVPGSEALANIADVVTGRFEEVTVERSTLAESTGALVSWALQLPTLPIGVVARHYRGPGFRVLVNVRHAAELGAGQVGSVVSEGVDLGERAAGWLGHRIDERLTRDAGHRVGDGPCASDGGAR